MCSWNIRNTLTNKNSYEGSTPSMSTNFKFKTMAELLTDEIVEEHLKEDGYMMEPDGPWILEYIEELHGSKLDYQSGWAKGHENRICYYQTTADSYEVYVCTDTHNHRDIYFEQDVFYYLDHSHFSEEMINELESGGDVWCDPSIWEDIEYEFNYELEQRWSDIYEELFEEKKDELLNSGDYEENDKE